MNEQAKRLLRAVDGRVLSRLPLGGRYGCYRLALSIRAKLKGRPLPVDADVKARLADLGTPRRHSRDLPDWMRQEIKGLRTEVDSTLYGGGLPRAHPAHHVSQPGNPARAGRRYRDIQSLFGRPTHVILLPWLRHGGADLAAIWHAKAIVAEPGARLAVLTTDERHVEWAGKLPEGTVFIDYTRLTGDLPYADRLAVLARLLVQAPPEVLHVINSGMGWRLLERHGLALSRGTRLYASLYADGHPRPDGAPTGYAHDFLAATRPYLTTVITDNASYPPRLTERFGVPPDQLSCIYLPNDMGGDSPRPSFGRPRVLWAGRLEPDKGTDLLLSIIKAMPEIEFDLYGPCDKDPAMTREFARLSNASLKGAYDGFASIPGPEHGCLVYTSGNGGIPNILVEAGSRGFPVVAPAVGGIPELIDASTGWIVDRSLGAEGFSEAIRHALRDPSAARQRGDALSARVHGRHSWASFVGELRGIGYLPAPVAIGDAGEPGPGVRHD